MAPAWRSARRPVSLTRPNPGQRSSNPIVNERNRLNGEGRPTERISIYEDLGALFGNLLILQIFFITSHLMNPKSSTTCQVRKDGVPPIYFTSINSVSSLPPRPDNQIISRLALCSWTLTLSRRARRRRPCFPAGPVQWESPNKV